MRKFYARGFGLAAALLGLGVLGCGSNQPCSTDPAQVDAARAEAQEANAAMTSTERELAAAEARKTELSQELSGMEDSEAMEARLELLKKGSGR